MPGYNHDYRVKEKTRSLTANLPPKPKRVPRKAKIADPVVIELIAWYRNNKDSLPQAPFKLIDYKAVTSPKEFYQRLECDINLYPRGPRSEAIGTDLRFLKECIDGNKNRFIG